jgi:hypothetical protein
LHVVVGLGRVLRAAAVRVEVERGEPERDRVAGRDHDLRALQEVVAHRWRPVPVLLVVVRGVVDEAHGQRGVAADQVVGGAAQVGIGPLGDVGVVQRLRAAVDDVIAAEHGVAERALPRERERRELDLDVERQRAARAVVLAALGVVVEHAPQHLVADDAERAVRQHRHRRRTARHRTGVVVGEHRVAGPPRRSCRST